MTKTLKCVFCGNDNAFGDGVVPVKNGGLCFEDYSCNKCLFNVFPGASAEIQIFVKHMEDNFAGVLSKDVGARAFWLTCKYYFNERGLLQK